MVVLHQRSDDKKQERENKDNNKLEITLGHKEKLLKPEEGTCYDEIASGWECTFMKMLCLFSSLFRSDTFYGSHMFANTVPKKDVIISLFEFDATHSQKGDKLDGSWCSVSDKIM